MDVIGVDCDRAGPTVTHMGHTVLPHGDHVAVAETLRFRTEHEIRTTVEAAGFDVVSVWGAWNRHPVGDGTSELIVLAQR